MSWRAAPVGGAAPVPKTFNADWLALRLKQLAGPLAGARLCVAFSGGADSTALLAACAALRRRHRFELRALHVNHRLQPDAAAWARAARRTGRTLGVTCRVLEAPVRVARGESPEAAARATRYQALQSQLRADEWLLLAQHQDDQAETLLLQLLRGAGVAGLAAMPARAGQLLRPLLPVPRVQLLEYLGRRGLKWVEDPSNVDVRYDRNYLRHKVLPALRARWPSLGITIGRSAGLAAEAQQLLDAQADAQLRDACDGSALQVAVLRRLPVAQRRNLLRRWIERQALPMPDQRRLQEIAGPMLRARADAQPQVRWPGAVLRRHGGLMHLSADHGSPSSMAHAALDWAWLEQPRLALPGGAQLALLPDAHGALSRDALPAQVQVRFRNGGASQLDRSQEALPQAHRLKRILQARALPPWQRAAVPLLYAGGRLLAVGDWWRSPELRHVAKAGAPSGSAGRRLRLQWRPA